MAKNKNLQTFEMETKFLRFDFDKSSLLCINKKSDNRKTWIKKLENITFISNIIEDKSTYYIACDSGEINGQFLAVSKESGTTKWFIPGKSFLQVIFKSALYLIFVDEKNDYYLLKVRRDNGNTSWYHRVDIDLREYSFTENKLILRYSSGKKEQLSLRSGKRL